MDNIKKLWMQIRQYIEKMSKKTRNIVIAAAVGVVAVAVALAFFLNNTGYSLLFSGVEDQEAVNIIAQLQADDIAYQHTADGDILVDSAVVEETRAQLVMSGYPQSGFNYDIFKEYGGGMVTNSEQVQYKLYELQDRIGATIRLFAGVSDAKVTIALPEEEKYVLSPLDDGTNVASASVSVFMENGASPSEEQAAGIQRLVATSVPGMLMENVAVLDSHGIEIIVTTEENMSLNQLADQTATIIENDIQRKVLNVLTPFFGSDNVKVSVKGQINMEKILRETSTYTVPEQINDEDKSGIVSNESTSSNSSNSSTETNTDVAGTETNAEAPQYNGGEGDQSSETLSETAVREYLVNQVIEQAQIDPGYLSDVSVSISINSYVIGDIDPEDLMDLVGNASGIDIDERYDKISIVSAPFFGYDPEEGDIGEIIPAGLVDVVLANPLPIIIAAAVILLILILIIVLLAKRRKRRKAEEAEAEAILAQQQVPGALIDQIDMEAINQMNEKSKELRETVRTFAEDNPEIAAQMIRSWINGGEEDGK